MMLAMPTCAPTLFEAMMADSLRAPLGCTLSNDRPRLAKQEDGTYVLTLSAPGVTPHDLKITAHDGVLKIDGETRTAAHTHVCHWATKLPHDADGAHATATHVDGLLTITIPKKAAAEPTVLAVNASMDDEDQEAADASSSSDAPHCTLSLSAPGISASELLVLAADEGVLKVSGESRRTGARLSKSVRLPRDSDAAHAFVSHVDGLLTITIPKKAASEPRTLTVNGAHEDGEATRADVEFEMV